MRLDKFLSNMLPYSRKEVKAFCKAGRILINGVVASSGETQLNPDKDQVLFDGKQVEYQPFIYLMLHKPQGYVSATEDRRFPVVTELVPQEYAHYELFPVGRLDIDTEGLLILTNDGGLAHELLSPKKHVDKTYLAALNRAVGEIEIEAFAKGVIFDDGYQTLPAALHPYMDEAGKPWAEVTVHEGKYHQIKRMFEAVDAYVVYLKRIKMGSLELDDSLKPGDIRLLTSAEIESLQSR